MHLSHKRKPLITVIVAVFNAASTLRRCLDSVINQTYPYKELIVIDGGSLDGSVEIIESYHTKISYWESQPDRGITHAWNKAMSKATGDWIYFLGADDYFWENDALEKVSEFISQVPEDIKVVYGKVVRLFENGAVLDIHGKPWEQIRPTFFYGMRLNHQGIFHHKSLFAEYGKFDESLQFAADYEMLLRYLKQHDAIFMEEIIAGSLLGGVSTQTQKRLAVLNEFTRIAQRHEINVFTIGRIISYLRALIRIFITATIGENISDKLGNIIRKANL
jgi:glycosyltransferase involved in cell wall biosynthesis